MNRIFLSLIIASIAGCGNSAQHPPKASAAAIPFEWKIVNSGLIRSETHETILTGTDIMVIQGHGADSVKFSTPVSASDTLAMIADLNPSSFSERYSNDLIADGLQLSISFRKGDTTRMIYISNFYEPRIGMVIDFINARIPEKYRIWYEREHLKSD